MSRVPGAEMQPMYVFQLIEGRCSCRKCFCGMISRGFSYLAAIPSKTAQKVCDLCLKPFRLMNTAVSRLKEGYYPDPNVRTIKVKAEDKPPGYHFFYGFLISKKVYEGIPYIQISQLIQPSPNYDPIECTSPIQGDAFDELLHRYVPDPPGVLFKV